MKYINKAGRLYLSCLGGCVTVIILVLFGLVLEVVQRWPQ